MQLNKWSALFVGVLAIGCSGGADSNGEGAGVSKETPKELKGKLEVQAFKGGYQIDFYQKMAKEFEALHPGLTIKVDGNPRVWEQLRPRFVAGNPPDLVFPGWGFDHWAGAEEGLFEDLNSALDGKPFEGEGSWRDTFKPDILKLGQSDGKQFMLPYYVMEYGWWYDPGLFERNGWTPPKTYEELLVLCEKIKAKGIAPITFQGQYPYYMTTMMMFPWVQSFGGIEAVRAAQNLEPGAWKSPAWLKAAQMIDELNKKGYFQKGAVAMSHTESQTQMLQGKAAMVPCGSWIESEMAANIPPGVKLRFFLPPVLADGKGDPTALVIGIEPWMVPVEGENDNKDAAIALFKYMTSLKNAIRFVEEKGTPMAIVGSDVAKIRETMVAPAEALKNAKTVYAMRYREWYPAFHKELENATTALLNGQLTPQGFCDRVEAAAEKTRNDPNIKKRTME
jgi:N-acetylglucosamine transport system substrate-binding protein